ncbi:exosortase H-associated membrane protein [Brevundimonas sp.]
MSLMARFAARTPEEAARRRFGLWAGLSLIVLLPLWWMWGADIVAAVLRPFAGLMVRLFGLTGEIRILADGDWVVGTPLTRGGQPVDYTLSEGFIRRVLLSVPLLAAFLIAPPRPPRPWRAVGISALVLAIVFAVSIAAEVWGNLAPMLDPGTATAASASTPLDQPPLNPVFAQIARIGRYIALSIAPLLSALVLWAILNPAGMKTLVAEITE